MTPEELARLEKIEALLRNIQAQFDQFTKDRKQYYRDQQARWNARQRQFEEEKIRRREATWR
ncbi:MAG TPA: hypothetical protein VGE97_02665 [Nitrososphaera sp.]|jgi:hypothetical protein